jgi:glycosyltransferase involved in cell wall biosynthesis
MSGDFAQALGERVSLPGFVQPDELARLYASVDFLALPSEVEIHSMATSEALASGCPAMVARAAGSTSMFGATPAVLAVDGGARNWAAAMRDLAADPERRATMRLAALEYRDTRLASWSEALYEDFLPGWRAALSIARGDPI